MTKYIVIDMLMFMKSSPLTQIQAPISEELIEFEKRFKSSMKSHIPLLNKITYYIVQRKGKQLRPILVFLSAKAWGNITESSYHAASLVEILHTGTLVHDDVVDDSYQRRGFFSVNALWKNKIAVLVGDYFLAQGLILALENHEYDLLQILTGAIKQMSEGEILQIEKARRLDIEEDIYYDIIKQKTASLIAAACSAGAASSSKDPLARDTMLQFGESLGIAFQIKDDLFDYGSEAIGKPKGIDIKEKKMTLPLIYALSQAQRSEKNAIINMIKRKSTDPKVIRDVIQFVKNHKGLKYAESAMHEYKNKTLEILNVLPNSDSKEALRHLVSYVVERKK